MQKSLTTKILTVGFLGILMAWGAGFAGTAHASEVTGSLATNMSAAPDTTSGSIAGTVVGGSNGSETTGSTGTTGTSGGGAGYFAAGGGGTGYYAIPVATIGAPAAGGPITYDSGIAYSSYPDYSASDTGRLALADDTTGTDDEATSTLPGVPSTGGILSPGDSLTAATVASGWNTALVIALVLLGIVILAGAAYGINSAYRRNRGY